jgi:phospholipid/cholesterol/gamma-HCH transport system ATP-binding protein
MLKTNDQRLTANDAVALKPAIEFRDVSLMFEDTPVLDRVSFTVPPGELRIVLGLAGSGKSTLLRLAIGLLKPDEGQIFLNGQEITTMPEAELIEMRKEIGVVFQEDALFTSVSVLENVGYRLLERGEDLERVEQEVRKVLRLVGLEHAIEMMPSELSGGMSRRTAVARALVGAPKLVLYDSPCSGLDPVTEKKILRLVMQLRDLNATTSMYVTQNMDEVQYLCTGMYERSRDGHVRFRKEKNEFCLFNTKILMLSEGRVIFDAADELFWQAEQTGIREFLV